MNNDPPMNPAAIITPPVNPNMVSNHRLFNSFKKKTMEAPAAVTSQVKILASKAAYKGPT